MRLYNDFTLQGRAHPRGKLLPIESLRKPVSQSSFISLSRTRPRTPSKLNHHHFYHPLNLATCTLWYGFVHLAFLFSTDTFCPSFSYFYFRQSPYIPFCNWRLHTFYILQYQQPIIHMAFKTAIMKLRRAVLCCSDRERKRPLEIVSCQIARQSSQLNTDFHNRARLLMFDGWRSAIPSPVLQIQSVDTFVRKRRVTPFICLAYSLSRHRIRPPHRHLQHNHVSLH